MRCGAPYICNFLKIYISVASECSAHVSVSYFIHANNKVPAFWDIKSDCDRYVWNILM